MLGKTCAEQLIAAVDWDTEIEKLLASGSR
jgi:hypothetical protein